MYTIPSSYHAELDQFTKTISSPPDDEEAALRQKIERVNKGVYEQRQKGTYMVRIRCAGGTIWPTQLDKVAQLARQVGQSHIHITTRQELQIHQVPLGEVPGILKQLAKAGLSTKGSGGNTVRNIVCSPESGVSDNEVFDVTPHCIALTNHLINKEGSWQLPRKFKIAFSNNPTDTGHAAFNDLGFFATLKEGRRGFQVRLGGGATNKPMTSPVAIAFVSETDLFRVADAAITFFNRFGNRRQRHKARMRYIFFKYGTKKAISLFQEIFKEQKSPSFIPDDQPLGIQNETAISHIVNPTDNAALGRWQERYVVAQRQPGLFMVKVPVRWGNLPLDVLEALILIIKPIGSDVIRFTERQSVLLRNIPQAHLSSIYHALQSTRLDPNPPLVIGNMVTCTGASTCQLGICYSKGAFDAIWDELKQHLPEDPRLAGFTINISGCPNGCGQHLLADLGFAGKVAKTDRIYPAYAVFAGARIEQENPTMGAKIGEIRARSIHQFTRALINLFCNSSYPLFADFIDAEQAAIAPLFKQFGKARSFEDCPQDYNDWGNKGYFSLDGRGSGECSVGILDRLKLEHDRTGEISAKLEQATDKALDKDLIRQGVLSGARLLLLSQDVPFKGDDDVCALFRKEFIDTQTVDRTYLPLIQAASQDNPTALLSNHELARRFIKETRRLYMELGDELKLDYPIKEIDAATLQTWLKEKRPVTLVDVREKWEAQYATLGGINIPLETLDEQLALIPKKGDVVVYCRTGVRSRNAIVALTIRHGYQNLFNLVGGTNGWVTNIGPAGITNTNVSMEQY